MAARVEHEKAQVEVEVETFEVEVWANDEHRIGLKPLLRRVWAKRGQPFVAPVEPRYQWSYLHGFVRPHDGATFWWLTSWVDVQAGNMVLREFAAWLGCGPRKKVLLVVDCAGWHTGDHVELPQGLELVFLPPRSPELQPC